MFRSRSDSRLVPEAGPFMGAPPITKGLRQLVKAYEFVDGWSSISSPMSMWRSCAGNSRFGARRLGHRGFRYRGHRPFRNGEIIELIQYMDTASLAVLAGRI